MRYDEFVGLETCSKEYKVLTLKRKISNKEAEQAILSAIWNYDSDVIDNLRVYISNNISRYITGFLCAHSDIERNEDAYLYIGIDDFGFVKGIPYSGDLSKDLNLSELMEQIMKTKIIIGAQDQSLLTESISWEVLPVQYNPQELEPINPLLSRYYQINQANREIIQAGEKVLGEWAQSYQKYQQKLSILFNNEPTRQELYEYIKENDPASKVLEMMDCGHQIINLSCEQLKPLMVDRESPYYWVCMWKDQKLVGLYKTKPIVSNAGLVNVVAPSGIFSKTSPLIPYWMQNPENPTLGLHVIKFKFTKKVTSLDIKYIDSLGLPAQCYRTVWDGEPCCRPIG